MVEIRLLRPDDRRDSFASGDVELDRFFHKFAGQNQFRLHIGSTYVAIGADEIVGFVTLSATSITIDDLPEASRKRLPNYPLPAARGSHDLRLLNQHAAKVLVSHSCERRLPLHMKWPIAQVASLSSSTPKKTQSVFTKNMGLSRSRSSLVD
ncbi:MAG: hypothetical protein R3C56_05735 [Pirellulaceae bacterium]